jgi:thiol-disulfide isomerase/thioredoxin
MNIVKISVVLAIVGFGFLSFNNDTNQPPVGLNVGDCAPLINATLLSGAEFASSDLKGKMVLIDFWASYDAGSRIANPIKAALYTEYQSKLFRNGQGFTVVSVSLDRFRNPLQKTIDADKLEYPYHICDFNGRESNLVETYQGQDLKKILIDGSGRVVVVSTNIEDITKALQRLSAV